MRWLVAVAACVAYACSAPAPIASPSPSGAPAEPVAQTPPVDAAPEPPPPPPLPPRFEPTAFTVEVTGTGRPVILIPGLGCPAAVWTGTVEHVKNAELHTIHAAGFAGHPAIDTPVISALRDQIIEYIRDRKLDHPIVVGHSMGGFLSIWIAETAPELLGGVVIVDAGPSHGGGDPDLQPVLKKQCDAYRVMADDQFARTIRTRFSPMFADPKKHDAIITAVTKSDPIAYADAFWELSSVDLRPDLSKITAPVLLVLSELPSSKHYEDQLAPIKKHMRVVTIAGTKHFVMLDQPDEFYRTLSEFIARH